ncbi:MAG: helix-turn-helix transcriptional regulator [Phycisphaerae bacterium]
MSQIEDGWWTEKQVAEFLGFKVSTLQAWRCRGGGPIFTVMNGRAVRYQIWQVKAWAERFGQQRHTHAPIKPLSSRNYIPRRQLVEAYNGSNE